MKNIKLFKEKLRSKYRKYRENLISKDKVKMDNQIFEKICSCWQFQKCRLILTYVSKENEIDTINIINYSLQNNKIVAVPRCIPGTYLMEFYLINSVDDLVKGMFGVLEPDILKCKKVDDFSSSVCIIPGISFDWNGYRLGYGKGYYDRFLSKYDGYKIGLCYSYCVKQYLPYGKFDCAVNLLITEKYVKHIKKGGTQ